MIKKIALVLTILLGVSSVPVQATAWTVTKDSVKVLIAAWLVWNGGSAVVNSLSPKVRKKLREDFEKMRAEGREYVKEQGGDLERYDEIMERQSKVASWIPAAAGVIGVGMTVGGLWLGYRGLSGLFRAEPQTEIW